jgi:hypothetical protein
MDLYIFTPDIAVGPFIQFTDLLLELDVQSTKNDFALSTFSRYDGASLELGVQ